MKLKLLKQRKWQDLGLYDSANGHSVLAYKVIDISTECKESAQVVIRYAKVERGTIAQILDAYTKGSTLGVLVHYHISEMSQHELENDGVFVNRASCMGIDRTHLAQIIFTNQ